ncbi:MAG: DUF4288 domain-containing protein [Terriglobales bacterium]
MAIEEELCVVHYSSVLLQAESPEPAYDRAVCNGMAADGSYLNRHGKRVHGTFRGISVLYPTFDDPGDGAELFYDSAVGVSEEEIKRSIPAKEDLLALRPAGNESGAAFASKETLAEIRGAIGVWRRSCLGIRRLGDASARPS